ncbi:MAG TPA: T9SS type A sorting domain-containing protein [Saprospiraceae bacterium]|nr:T9SS type A sorting domain-containing protein [Saprospiraceae bacterium]
MNTIIRIFFIFFIVNTISAQVPRKVIVEHFTNTKCPICKSRNPGFYTNINNQPAILHLAIHPSSPYASCVLSQQNNPDNDNRTKYYGVYGGTPRLVIQGKVISENADYNSSSLFTPFLGTTSPIELKIEQFKYKSDSIHVKITATAVVNNSLGSLKLFAALAEDTVFYASPNGETQHYDVYRKSLFGATGTTINIPANVGESIVYEASANANAIWKFSRIYTVALLQDVTTKDVIQAEASSPYEGITFPTSIDKINSEMEVSIYPNPASSVIHVKLEKEQAVTASLISIDGTLLQKHQFTKSTDFNVEGLSKGYYIIELNTDNSKYSKKVKVE